MSRETRRIALLVEAPATPAGTLPRRSSDGRLLIALFHWETQTEVFSVSLDDVATLLKE